MAALVKVLHSGWNHTLLGRVKLIVTMASVAFWLFPSIMLLWDAPHQRAIAKYEQVVDHIRSIVPPNSIVLADARYWFGLEDYKFYQLAQLSFYHHVYPASTLEDAFFAHRPDFIIVDSLIGFHFPEVDPGTDPHSLDPIQQHLRLDRAEYMRFLQDRTQLVAYIELEGAWPVSVYRVTWDDQIR